MKNIINGIIVLVLALATQQLQAQGTVYLSNISNGGHGGVGEANIGSDFWWAAPFLTGTNSGGYILNSILFYWVWIVETLVVLVPCFIQRLATIFREAVLAF
jgi:hypothetical protein